jgi:GNAT superfamily N-acetyltransferase
VDVTIRAMAVADVAAVGLVHVRAWQTAYRGVMPDSYLDGLRAEDRAEMWRAAVEVARPRVGLDVIEADGEIVGFACYGPDRDAGEHEAGELVAINLDPDHWRHGLGRRLVRHVTSELSRLGYRRAVLWVVRENDRARRFYESEGWTYDPGSDRVETVQDAPVNEVRYSRRLGIGVTVRAERGIGPG